MCNANKQIIEENEVNIAFAISVRERTDVMAEKVVVILL